MYRVELKAYVQEACPFTNHKTFLMYRVELKGTRIPSSSLPFDSSFLMYRVELKGIVLCNLPTLSYLVPNVPCGVERCGSSSSAWASQGFLMYRVELKAFLRKVFQPPLSPFLMYRVELKETCIFEVLA